MGRFAVLIQRLTGWDEAKVQLKIWRTQIFIACTCFYAIALFILLWMIAAVSGCSYAGSPTIPAIHENREISVKISRITSQMRRSGCFPKDVNVSYMNPTSYTISVSGFYYERYDTNNVEGVIK